MTIASEITRLQNDKAAICTAIENKGVTVGSVTLDSYAACIDAIEGDKNCRVNFALLGGGGGGGGGYDSGSSGGSNDAGGGGGGAGGYWTYHTDPLCSSSITVTIGAGGAGGPGGASGVACRGSNGGATIITDGTNSYCVCGGGGGGFASGGGSNGGSGGGAGGAHWYSNNLGAYGGFHVGCGIGTDGGFSIKTEQNACCCWSLGSGGGGGGAYNRGKSNILGYGTGATSGDGGAGYNRNDLGLTNYAGGGGGGENGWHSSTSRAGCGYGGGGNGGYVGSCCACRTCMNGKDATGYGAGGGGGAGLVRNFGCYIGSGGAGKSGFAVIYYDIRGCCGFTTATGGDYCCTVGNTKYHIFTSNGTFTIVS